MQLFFSRESDRLKCKLVVSRARSVNCSISPFKGSTQGRSTGYKSGWVIASTSSYSSVTADLSNTCIQQVPYFSLQQQRQRQCSVSRGYTVTWISERFMPSQINTKSCPERISFAPLRHGRYFNRDTFVPCSMRKNWISKREKGSGSLFSASPKICSVLFATRVKNIFDVDIARVYHLLQTVMALFVCKSRTCSIIFL